MALPQLTVSASAAKRISHFDCWVFRDELRADGQAAVPNGEVVELVDGSGTFLAYAFWSAHSHIAARIVSTDRARPIDRALLVERLKRAIARRADLTGTNAARLVFSEADGIPGLIVDRYAEYLVIQIRTAALERWRPVVVDALQDLLRPKGILERSDKEFREEEGLPTLVQGLAGSVPERIRIDEHGLRFWVDPYHGHKTGFYLDQRDTRQAVRQLIQPQDRVADVFSYTGAFAVAAASRGADVVCVEQEDAHLALAREHAALNQVADRMTFIHGDAFYWLEAKAGGRERFDWVLLDPPSLAKNKSEALKGRRALHHLLINALGLLKPEGTLVFSLCTYHLLGLAEEILRIAAAERSLRLRIRHLAMQATDHPWILQMPMTRYLMSWIAQSDAPPAA